MFIVVSSVDLPQSVEQMVDIRQQILECKSSRAAFNVQAPHNVPILFVMNKTDLPKSRWQTDPEEAASLLGESISGSAKDVFLTCSAAENENIETRLIRNQYPSPDGLIELPALGESNVVCISIAICRVHHPFAVTTKHSCAGVWTNVLNGEIASPHEPSAAQDAAQRTVRRWRSQYVGRDKETRTSADALTILA
uniref:ADP-ribosylation factor family protein n=1 Tax=Steinernema glaseri TaxID=37863 RepID=A0A1I7ZBT5_9BILA